MLPVKRPTISISLPRLQPGNVYRPVSALTFFLMPR